VVIDVMHQHGGWVNKFEGDAALCIFGAPLDCDDAASSALAAARDLAGRLADLLVCHRSPSHKAAGQSGHRNGHGAYFWENVQ
jgi:class 3 adenylate cyclase